MRFGVAGDLAEGDALALATVDDGNDGNVTAVALESGFEWQATAIDMPTASSEKRMGWEFILRARRSRTQKSLDSIPGQTRIGIFGALAPSGLLSSACRGADSVA